MIIVTNLHEYKQFYYMTKIRLISLLQQAICAMGNRSTNCL